MIELRRYDPDQLELLSRTSPDDLGRAIAEKIATPGGEFWKDFIRFTQHLQVADPEVRKLLSSALFQAARFLRERDLTTEEETLWAALRMAAVFAPKPEGLAPLTGFLGDRQASWVQQVSLQAISNVCPKGPLPNIPELRDLGTLVEFSANRFCQGYLLGVPALASVAIASVVAARAMGMEDPDGRWRDEFRAHPLLLRQLDDALTELTSEWPEEAKKASGRLPGERKRDAVLEWLEKPPHRQLADLEKTGGSLLLEAICTELRARDNRLEAAIQVLARERQDSQIRESLAYRAVQEMKHPDHNGPRHDAVAPPTGHEYIDPYNPDVGLRPVEQTPAQARRARRVAADPGPRQRPRLIIGQEFVHPSTGHRWRVTDVGTRTFLAVDLTAVAENHPGDPSWLNGPPYAGVESTWDEYDARALLGVAGVDWEDALPDPCPAPHAHSGGYRDNRYPCTYCGKVPDMTGKCTACWGQGKVIGDCGESPNVWYDKCETCKGTGNAPVEGVAASSSPNPLELLLREARAFARDWRTQEGSSRLDALADAIDAHDAAEAAQGARKL